MSKTAKWLLVAFLLLLAAALAVGGVFLKQRRDFRDAELTMGAERELSLTHREDGGADLRWPGEQGKNRYYVEVRPAGDPAGEPLYSALCSEPGCTLPAALPQREMLELRVYARTSWEMLGHEENRLCDDPISVTVFLACPAAEELSVSVDENEQQAAFSWTGLADNSYRFYVSRDGGEPQLLGTLTGESAAVAFGEGGGLPVPERGETFRFWLEAFREKPGLRYPGVSSETVSVVREDLLGVTLDLRCEREDDSSFRLSWEETKGESYAVLRQEEDGSWTTLAEIPAGEERVYHTGHLPPFSSSVYRVEARGGQVQPMVYVALIAAILCEGVALLGEKPWTDFTSVIGAAALAYVCMTVFSDGIWNIAEALNGIKMVGRPELAGMNYTIAGVNIAAIVTAIAASFTKKSKA